MFEQIQLTGTKNFRQRESTLHLELRALIWAMKSMLNYYDSQNFRTDCKDLITMIVELHVCQNFSTELDTIKIL